MTRLKAVYFLLEVALNFSGVDTSLRIPPGLTELTGIECTDSVDSVFGSSSVTSTKFYLDKEDSEISPLIP